MIFEDIWDTRPDGVKVWNPKKAAAGLGGIFTPSMRALLCFVIGIAIAGLLFIPHY